MSYDEIDEIIKKWSKKNKIHLMSEDNSPHRRYFYISSKIGETFQFVIEPDIDGYIRIDAHLIESPFNEEGHFIWNVPTVQFVHGLDLSLGSAQAWFKRKEG